jgi:amino-acid N-acetyltransferase
MHLIVEVARPHELGDVLELLKSANLPSVGVAEEFGHYLVARDDESVIGVCGVELHGQDGLLRSLVVDQSRRSEGVGSQLVRRAEALAHQMGLRDLYVLTVDRERFFARMDYAVCAREAASAPIRESWEFRVGCPGSAVVMKKPMRVAD